MELMKIFEIFSLVTGLVYIYLEIKQKNAMWVVCILTGLAAVAVFMYQRLYASMALNLYYVCISFWGLYAWMRASRKLDAAADLCETAGEGGSADMGKSSSGERIHLRRLGRRTMLLSLAVLIAGVFALTKILALLGDPMSVLDSFATVLSAIATVWLGRSYLGQWLLWVVADLLSAVMCFSSGMYWLCALYALYSASAVYGYFHWRSKGVYIG